MTTCGSWYRLCGSGSTAKEVMIRPSTGHRSHGVSMLRRSRLLRSRVECNYVKKKKISNFLKLLTTLHIPSDINTLRQSPCKFLTYTPGLLFKRIHDQSSYYWATFLWTATFTFQLLDSSHKLFDFGRSHGLQVSRHASLSARADGFFTHSLQERSRTFIVHP